MRTFFQHPKKGFRFSVTDLVVIILAMGGALLLWKSQLELALLILFIVLNFFLFCNVFRVRRKWELLWKGIFLTQCIIAQSLDWSWLWSFGFQIPVTVILLFLETGHESYHGVGFLSRITKNNEKLSE